MKTKICKCGCGGSVNGNNTYINGHNFKGKKKKPISEQTRLRMSKSQKCNKNRSGKKLSDEHKKAFTFKDHNHSDESKSLIKQASIGRLHSDEDRLKMSNSAMGHKPTLLEHTDETKKKISAALKGRVFTDDHKRKLRGPKSLHHRSMLSIATVKYLKNHNYTPRRGSNEDAILDIISESLHIDIIRNSLSVAQKTGKYPDGYIKDLNLVIEILEKHHYDSDGTLKQYDVDREMILKDKLKCDVYYISENDFLKDPKNEIEKLKQYVKEILC